MKIFAFVDTHGSAKAFNLIKKRIEQFEPELIVCAGDFTVFEKNVKKILSCIDSFGKKVFIIHGNHETEQTLRQLCPKFKNLAFMHKKAVLENGILFAGYGGGGFSDTDKDFERWADSIKGSIAKNKKMIFFSHAPPYGTRLDSIQNQYHGNRSYTQFIIQNSTKINLVICGHLHETAGRMDRIGDCVILNPGPLGALIEL